VTIRRRIASAAIACLLGGVGVGLVAAPAQAADTYSRYGNVASPGQCMEWPSAVNNPARVNSCSSYGNQVWRLENAAQGGLYLHDTTYNGCLDAHGTGDGIVYMITCNGGAYQRWYPNWDTGYLRFQNEQSHRCLDSHGGSDGDALWQIGCNAGAYQEWRSSRA
jgi:hypothetical protein